MKRRDLVIKGLNEIGAEFKERYDRYVCGNEFCECHQMGRVYHVREAALPDLNDYAVMGEELDRLDTDWQCFYTLFEVQCYIDSRKIANEYDDDELATDVMDGFWTLLYQFRNDGNAESLVGIPMEDWLWIHGW